MPKTPRNRIRTWADGFGNWHAHITLGLPIAHADLAGQLSKLRASARRAIRRELLARDALGNGYRIKLYQSAESQAGHREARLHLGIDFAERRA